MFWRWEWHFARKRKEEEEEEVPIFLALPKCGLPAKKGKGRKNTREKKPTGEKSSSRPRNKRTFMTHGVLYSSSSSTFHLPKQY